MSLYNHMWMLVMFDLPTETKMQRKSANRFRKVLLNLGLEMMQYSCYIRSFPSELNGLSYQKIINKNLPEYGNVRVLFITDIQFSKMKSFIGKTITKNEEPSNQLLLF